MPAQSPPNIEIRTPEDRERALNYMARHERKSSITGSERSSNHQERIKNPPQTAAVMYPHLQTSSNPGAIQLRAISPSSKTSSTKDLHIPSDSDSLSLQTSYNPSTRPRPSSSSRTQSLGLRDQSGMSGGISGGVVNTFINNGTINNRALDSILETAPSSTGRACTVIKSGLSTILWLCCACLGMLKSPFGRGLFILVGVWMWLRPCSSGLLRDAQVCQFSAANVVCQWFPPVMLCKPAIRVDTAPTSDTTFAGSEWSTFSGNAHDNPSEIMHLVCRTVREHHHNVTKRNSIPGHQALDVEVLRLAWLINNTQSLQIEYQLMSYSVWTKIDQQLGPIAATLDKLLIENKTFSSAILLWLNPFLEKIGLGAEYYQNKYRQTLTTKLAGIKVQLEQELLPAGRKVEQGNRAVEDQFYVVRDMSERGRTLLRDRYDRQNSWTGWAWAGFSSIPAKETRKDMEILTVIVDSSVQHANRLSDLGLVHTTKVRTVMTTGSYLNQEKFDRLDHDEFAQLIKEWAEFAKAQVSAAKRDTYHQPEAPITVKTSY